MRYLSAALLILLWCVPSSAGVLERAQQHLPVYRQAVADHWPNMPLPHIPCGQVEQESSWKERATLKTSRELGRGLTQMTIAYRPDGSERFNIYREAVKWRALRAWDWRNDPYNVQYQLAFLVLQDRANFTAMTPFFRDDTERWKASLVSYNAGQGRVLARRAVAVSRGIPTDRWTGGLDGAHGPQEDKLLYGRPLWKAVNEYPVKVLQRSEKYRSLFRR